MTASGQERRVVSPPEVSSPPRQRVRFVYEKGEAIKFIGPKDEARAWERTLRRADLPLLYKQGFNPQPHIQFAAPLGLGMTGVREIVDVVFSPPVPVDELERRIREKLPPGMRLIGLEEVPLKAPTLQSRTIGADYTLVIHATAEELSPTRVQEHLRAFLEAEEIWRTRVRKGRPYQYNLRPLVLELAYRGYDPEAEEHRIFLRVQMRPGAAGRPDEVVDAMGLGDFARTLRRERIYFAGEPEDEAVFQAYPVVSQEAITRPMSDGPEPAPRRRRRSGKRATRPKGLKSFAEKAADEFA